MEKKLISRRKFSKTILAASTTVALSGTFYSGCGPAKLDTKKLVAIQLYTLRDIMRDDFTGGLEKVAKIGYDAVEFAGFGGLKAKEVKQRIKDLGLLPAGSHEGFDGLNQDITKRLDFNLEIGNKFLVVPSMPGKWRENGVDGIKAFGEKMNAIGEAAHKVGIHLCYHNHSFEFEMIDGKSLYDHLFEVTDPNLVKAEVDVYWVKHGGIDPSSLLKKYAGRCPLLHLKDMTAGDNPTFAPVGEGIIDIEGIIKTAHETGYDWLIVEQDRTQRPVLEAVEISLKNIRRFLAS